MQRPPILLSALFLLGALAAGGAAAQQPPPPSPCPTCPLNTTGTRPEGTSGIPPEGPKSPAPKIRWRPFGHEAFQAAADLRRPILLYISAPWEYHDRAMDALTYADPDVVDLVESAYIPVRVSTDMRPDVFARYGMGAWPSTAVLLGSGHPLYYPEKEGKTVARAGGSFYPPAEFREYFSQMADYYSRNREMVDKLSAATDEALLGKRNVGEGTIAPEQIETVIGRVIDAYGVRPSAAQPRDRHPDFDMIDLAFYYWLKKADRKVLDISLNYLTDMARGGIYDRLGGGFFRYAHDTMFTIPAFEKVPSTNARAIEAYLAAYELTANGRFLPMARSTIEHVRRHGIDPASHAFTGAMAAGSAAGDNGDYYTWTEDEVKAALTPEEWPIAAAAFDIRPFGEMLDTAPRRNVLFLAEGPKLLAARFKIDEKKAEETLETIRTKLLAAREKRQAPPVDPATYGDWSGMMASAFITASRTLQEEKPAREAIAAMEVLLARCRDDRGLVLHVCLPAEAERGGEAFFSDQAWVSGALLDAYEQTGDERFLTESRAIVDRASDLFRDTLSGGWGDRIADPNAPGLMAWPVRDLPDNMQMVKVLLRLGHLTGREAYFKSARSALESLADEIGDYQEHAAPYALASQMSLTPPLEIIIAGDPGMPDYEKGRQRALSLYHPWRIVRNEPPGPGAAEIRKRGLKPLSGAQVAFCIGSECAGPFKGGEPLRAELEKFLNKGASQAPVPKKNP